MGDVQASCPWGLPITGELSVMLGRARATNGHAAFAYLAGCALEIGYDTDRCAPHVFGAFLRYGAWIGTESPLFTDFPDELSSGELTIGARWNFSP